MSLPVKMLLQTALLSLIYLICKWLETALDLPVPANVLGIIILFFLLFFGIIKETYIQEAASFFLKHLVFFFVPVAVGLMEWGKEFYDYGLVLFLALIVSLVVPFCAVGLCMQKFAKKEKN